MLSLEIKYLFLASPREPDLDLGDPDLDLLLAFFMGDREPDLDLLPDFDLADSATEPDWLPNLDDPAAD